MRAAFLAPLFSLALFVLPALSAPTSASLAARGHIEGHRQQVNLRTHGYVDDAPFDDTHTFLDDASFGESEAHYRGMRLPRAVEEERLLARD